MRAVAQRIFAVGIDLGDRPVVYQGADIGCVGKSVSGVHRLHLGAKCSKKPVFDAALHIDAVGRDAGLAGIAEFGGKRRFHRNVQIGIVEDQQRSIAAQFEAEALDGGRTGRR